jgi:hypothetical protein
MVSEFPGTGPALAAAWDAMKKAGVKRIQSRDIA